MQSFKPFSVKIYGDITVIQFMFSFVAQQPNLGRPVFRFPGHTQLDTHIHTHTVGLLSTSDQLVVAAATYTTHNKQNKTTAAPLAIKELKICA
jgi:hypothetical protein